MPSVIGQLQWRTHRFEHFLASRRCLEILARRCRGGGGRPGGLRGPRRVREDDGLALRAAQGHEQGRVAQLRLRVDDLARRVVHGHAERSRLQVLLQQAGTENMRNLTGNVWAVIAVLHCIFRLRLFLYFVVHLQVFYALCSALHGVLATETRSYRCFSRSPCAMRAAWPRRRCARTATTCSRRSSVRRRARTCHGEREGARRYYALLKNEFKMKIKIIYFILFSRNPVRRAAWPRRRCARTATTCSRRSSVRRRARTCHGEREGDMLNGARIKKHH